MKRAIDVAPFGELADPRIVAELAAAAEDRGWAGFFVWDHIMYRAPVRAVADPWVTLAAIACATSTLRIGPMITPLSRRRVRKLARETVTLDILSSGRLTLGVGLGSARNGELEAFGEVTDPRDRGTRPRPGHQTMGASGSDLGAHQLRHATSPVIRARRHRRRPGLTQIRMFTRGAAGNYALSHALT
jgi:hypothetical protein